MDFFGDDETETPGQNTDSVEADVLIETTIENAWALVSEPGWWINDGPLGDHDVEHGDDGLYHVTDPEAGTWLVEKLDEDPMDVVRFRWYPVASDEFPEETLTTVEVSLSEEKGKIALHVEEFGISALSDDEDEAYQLWENEAGLWDQAVDSAKDYLERR